MSPIESAGQASHSLPPCFAVIGHSGVGKSTLISLAMEASWPQPWRPRLLRKWTTRPLRCPAEAAELVTVAPEEFAVMQSRGDLCVTFENHGERYGLPQAEIQSLSPGEFGLLSTNTSAAIALRDQSTLQTFVVLLEADPETRAGRLQRRGDAGTEASFLSRLHHAADSRRQQAADAIIDTSGTIEQAFQDFRKVIESILTDFHRTS